MDLIAIPRPPETYHGNLFLRLSQKTARHLHEVALSCTQHETTEEIPVDDSSDVIDFLPIEVTFRELNNQSKETITLYGSYNGGTPGCLSLINAPYRNENVDDIIEISPDLHPSLKQIFNSSSKPVNVTVRALPYVPVAKQVTFEPLSTSDWEMIEMEASVLEDGGLLNQITIVYPGQILPLRLLPPERHQSCGSIETAAWVKVVEDGLGDEMDNSSESDSYSGQFESDAEHEKGSDPCIRLMAETEVIVIPKPRFRESDQTAHEPINLPSRPFRVQPTILDYPNTDLELIKPYLPTPRLSSIYVHSSTALEIPGYQPVPSAKLETVLIRRTDAPHSQNYRCNDMVETDSITVATLNINDKVKEGHVALHPFLRYQLSAQLFKGWVSIQLLPDDFVRNTITHTSDAIIDGREKVGLHKVSLSIERLALAWKIPDECMDKTLCNKCQNKCEPDDSEVLDGSALICQGSLVSAKHLWMCGADELKDTHTFYRVKFDPSMLLHENKVGPISRIGELAKFINGFRRGDEELQTLIDPEAVNISSESVEVTYDTVENFGISSLPPTDNTQSIEDQLLSTISEILCIDTQRSIHVNTDFRLGFVGITGEEGIGKTHSSINVASRLSCTQMNSVVYLGCRKLQSSPQNTLVSIIEELQSAFDEAVLKQPSVLILDDLDCLIPNVESGDTGDGSVQHQTTNPALISQVKVIVDHLILISREMIGRVVCLFTCKDGSALSSRFMKMVHAMVDVPSFDATQRAKFLHQQLFCPSIEHHEIPHSISRLGRLTDGYRPRDLNQVAKRIRDSFELRELNDYDNDSPSRDSMHLDNDISRILHDFVPLSQQSLEISHNDIVMEWHSIGGMFRAKQLLHDTIIHPMKFRRIYNNVPTKLPTGLMIFGFPGCGKSFVVPSLAKVSNLNLITCRGPELLDRYIGASEAKVRQLFARAAAASPSILFFDDFDSLAPQRGSDHTGVTDRVVNQLLTLLDGAERSAESHIFVVAATSRPDKIDNALLRPGRLERHVYIGHPESQSEWNSLFSSMLTLRSVDAEVKLCQEREDLFSTFCQGLDHAKAFCAADLKAVLDTAHLMAVHEIIGSKSFAQGKHHVVLGKQHIKDAFRRTRPSLLLADKLMFKRSFQSFLTHDLKVDGSEWYDGSLTSDSGTAYSDIKLKTSLR